jgi:RNA polymerase sigma factor (sigma-70 family)
LNETDEELMRLYSMGQPEAFDRLYRRHEAATWRFILRLVGNESVANELMQDTWFSVARHAATWQPAAQFNTWLLTIARNRVTDFFRAQRPTESLDADDSMEQQSVPDALIADSILGPVRQVQSRQLAQALIDAVEQLPADQKEAFLLQAEGDLAVEDIALVTGVSFETAKSRLRYARNKLKSLLHNYDS